jgi:hypothetical protein
MPGLTVDEVVGGETISAAYDWLWERRNDYPDAADLWSFRRNWERERKALIEQVLAGAYRYQLLTRLTLKSGIALGCPPSPVLGSFFLHELDVHFEESGLFYIRFMDDILVPAPTRWKLRRAVKMVNQALDALRLEKHPEKTFIGRVEKGFDFLGYHLRPGRIEVCRDTLRRFAQHALRLYEREHGPSESQALLGEYVRRWAAAGLCASLAAYPAHQT